MIYLMSAENSTRGGALDSISQVGEACCIHIGRNDVFLECFHKRKGSIPNQQKSEEKCLIISTLLLWVPPQLGQRSKIWPRVGYRIATRHFFHLLVVLVDNQSKDFGPSAGYQNFC